MRKNNQDLLGRLNELAKMIREADAEGRDAEMLTFLEYNDSDFAIITHGTTMTLSIMIAQTLLERPELAAALSMNMKLLEAVATKCPTCTKDCPLAGTEASAAEVAKHHNLH